MRNHIFRYLGKRRLMKAYKAQFKRWEYLADNRFISLMGDQEKAMQKIADALDELNKETRQK